MKLVRTLREGNRTSRRRNCHWNKKKTGTGTRHLGRKGALLVELTRSDPLTSPGTRHRTTGPSIPDERPPSVLKKEHIVFFVLRLSTSPSLLDSVRQETPSMTGTPRDLGNLRPVRVNSTRQSPKTHTFCLTSHGSVLTIYLTYNSTNIKPV